MHYLIDGYNWLLRCPPKSHLSLEQKRRIFLEEIHYLTKGSSCLVTVVFDSSDPSRDLYSRGHFKDIEVIFTPKRQTADEYIEASVESAKYPHEVTVVTRDRELKDKCLIRGAAVISTTTFFSQFTKKKSQKGKDSTKTPLRESNFHKERLLAIFEKELKGDGYEK
jgi:predicted RNA-binding protein with PIN domain